MSNSMVYIPSRGPMAIGHMQRAIIVRMNAHYGYWPQGSTLSTKEHQAMKALVRREIVMVLPDGRYYLPAWIRSETRVWYDEHALDEIVASGRLDQTNCSG
jgi:hypothetical protein